MMESVKPGVETYAIVKLNLSNLFHPESGTRTLLDNAIERASDEWKRKYLNEVADMDRFLQDSAD